MSSRHLVDPELAPALDLIVDAPLTHEALASIRKAMDDMFVARQRPVAGVQYGEERIPGFNGGPAVRVAIYRSEKNSTAAPGLLHIHGGGYVSGCPEAYSEKNAKIAAKFGAVVISVSYRLAPENPFPAPLDDCYAALVWFFANASALGVDPTRISIAGDSAGGGLAAALTQRARDVGELKICSQHLNSPMLDDRTGTPEAPRSPMIGEFLWTRDKNIFGWNGYLKGRRRDELYAAPARTADLSGLPPAWIGVGALDLFLDENVDYARRLAADGVGVDLHVYAGAYHGFSYNEEADVARRFVRDYHDSLARAWGI